MSICEHPVESYQKRHSQFNHCQVCGHVCLACKVADEISWSSGLCDGCYRIADRQRRDQAAKWADEDKQRERERIWAEGHAAGRQDEYCLTPNPYREMSNK